MNQKATSVQELDNFLKQFNCIDMLVEIGKLSRKVFDTYKAHAEITLSDGKRSFKHTVSQWSLVFIAYRAIMVSNDGRNKDFTFLDLMKAIDFFNNLYDPVIEDGDIPAALSRITQEQFWWQEINIPNLLARYRYIFSLNNFFTDEFLKLTGLTLKDFYVIGYAICALTNTGNPCFRIANLTGVKDSETLQKVLFDENIRKFLGVSAGKYQAIRDASQATNKVCDTRYQKFEFNPLFKYPVVEGDDRFPYYSSSFQFVIPNILGLVKKVAQGPYWDLRTHFESIKSLELLTKFGAAFENYCGNLLKNHFGTTNVTPVQEVLGSGPKDEERADWIVREKEQIYIFECKSSLLPLIVRQTFQQKSFYTWIDDNLNKGISQVSNTEKLLKQKCYVGSEEVTGFVLLLEDLHLAEVPMFKTSIIEEFLKKAVVKNGKVYFMRVFELEKMEEPIKKYSFGAILKKKIEIDKENNIAHGRDFLFACKEIDGNLDMRSHFLENIYDDLFSEFSKPVK